MVFFDPASPELGRPRGASGCETLAADIEAVLIREQYRALAQLAPYFYGAAIAAAAMLGIAAEAWGRRSTRSRSRPLSCRSRSTAPPIG